MLENKTNNWGQEIEKLATEIARLKMERNTLTHLKDRLDLVFEFAPDGFVLLDQDGKLNYCNKSFGILIGYDPKKLIGKNLFELDLFAPKQIRKIARFLPKKIKNYSLETEEFRLQREDGREIEVEIKTFPVKVKDLITIVLVARDITERNRAKELLQKSEARYRTIFESSRDAITLTTADGKFLGCNPAALKMFGLSEEKELVSKVAGDLSPKYQPDGELSSKKILKMLKMAKRKGAIFLEWKCKRKDGIEFFSTILITKFELDGKTVFQTTARDITDQKMAEQALIERQKELEEINTTLNFLLKKRGEDKKKVEEEVVFNMKRMVEPYLDKLKGTHLDEKQKLYVSILAENLKDIISTFPHAASSSSLKLTPTELEVASLVKQGKTTKQIATALNISFRTAEVHREHIRKKFDLKNRKENLRTHLLSISPS